MTSKDYECLQENTWLNDTIIDFSLQNVKKSIKDKDKEKIYIFSTHFYTVLTSKMSKSEENSGQTQAQIRFENVKNWTKDVDLFDKDFIVVPIHEKDHWFVAVICSPDFE